MVWNGRAFLIILILFILTYFMKTHESFEIIDIQIRENKKPEVKVENQYVSAEEAYNLASENVGWAYPPFS